MAHQGLSRGAGPLFRSKLPIRAFLFPLCRAGDRSPRPGPRGRPGGTADLPLPSVFSRGSRSRAPRVSDRASAGLTMPRTVLAVLATVKMRGDVRAGISVGISARSCACEGEGFR